MISEAFITFIFLLICLAALTVVAIVRFLQIIVNAYRRRQWLKRFAPEDDNIKQCIVGFIPQNRVGDFKSKTAVETTPGILQYGQNRARFLMPYDRDSRAIEIEFDRDTRLNLLIAKPWLAQFIPPLIRFINPEENRSYYFTAINCFGFPNSRKTKKKFDDLAREFDGQTLTYNRPPPPLKPALNVTVLAILFLVAGAIVSGFKLGIVRGPGLIDVAPSGDVFAADKDYLYHLDVRGDLQNQYVLQELGIRDVVTDIYAVDRDRVWLGDWQTGTIKTCQLDRKTCEPLPAFQEESSEKFRFGKTFKFALDRQNNLIYATDTVRHLLVVLTMDGQLLEKTRGGEIKLCYPNGITIYNSETIAVADSNNFRVITWETNPRGTGLTPNRQIDFIRPPQPQEKCEFRDGPGDPNRALSVADEGRIYPVFVEFDNRGFWWVLVGDGDFARDNLLRFDRDWENPQKISLPGNPDISHLAVAEDRVLLTVPEAYEIWSISLDDLSVSFFGNETFQQSMYEAQQFEDNLRRFYYGSLGVAIAGVIILLGVVAWEQRRQANALLDLDPTLSDS